MEVSVAAEALGEVGGGNIVLRAGGDFPAFFKFQQEHGEDDALHLKRKLDEAIDILFFRTRSAKIGLQNTLKRHAVIVMVFE